MNVELLESAIEKANQIDSENQYNNPMKNLMDRYFHSVRIIKTIEFMPSSIKIEEPLFRKIHEQEFRFATRILEELQTDYGWNDAQINKLYAKAEGINTDALMTLLDVENELHN